MVDEFQALRSPLGRGDQVPLQVRQDLVAGRAVRMPEERGVAPNTTERAARVIATWSSAAARAAARSPARSRPANL